MLVDCTLPTKPPTSPSKESLAILAAVEGVRLEEARSQRDCAQLESHRIGQLNRLPSDRQMLVRDRGEEFYKKAEASLQRPTAVFDPKSRRKWLLRLLTALREAEPAVAEVRNRLGYLNHCLREGALTPDLSIERNCLDSAERAFLSASGRGQGVAEELLGLAPADVLERFAGLVQAVAWLRDAPPEGLDAATQRLRQERLASVTREHAELREALLSKEWPALEKLGG